jgi:hypothetical protein
MIKKKLPPKCEPAILTTKPILLFRKKFYYTKNCLCMEQKNYHRHAMFLLLFSASTNLILLEILEKKGSRWPL